jgi:hypothetical protein
MIKDMHAIIMEEEMDLGFIAARSIGSGTLQTPTASRATFF